MSALYSSSHSAALARRDLESTSYSTTSTYINILRDTLSSEYRPRAPAIIIIHMVLAYSRIPWVLGTNGQWAMWKSLEPTAIDYSIGYQYIVLSGVPSKICLAWPSLGDITEQGRDRSLKIVWILSEVSRTLLISRALTEYVAYTDRNGFGLGPRP